ncbi:MAG: TIGR00730 family Rossman fold protein, partial [Cryomorphaceae bacterium]|nr:TIGR00730 family Rossman fold protein [Cryomorphaceae bacterium]
LTLIQTRKSEKFPIILVGSEFWEGIIDWLRNTLLLEKNINKEDLDLLKIADTKDEVMNILEEFHNNYEFSPNF